MLQIGNCWLPRFITFRNCWTAFGQSSVFGRTICSKTINVSPFGAQTRGFNFCGTSTGVFRTQASSAVIGASSKLVFWTTMPAFGALSIPFFGGPNQGPTLAQQQYITNPLTKAS